MIDMQKAGIWHRAGALLLDAILCIVLSTGIMIGLFALTGYDKYAEEVEKLYNQYEERYGIDLSSDYGTLTDEEKAIFDKANEEWIDDKNAQQLQAMQIKLIVIVTSLSVFFSLFILGFVVPLFFKNGQTIGKKLFGLGVVDNRSIRLKVSSLFIRTVLGKYTIEVMVPLLLGFMIFFGLIGIVGPVVLIALLVLQAILLFSTKNNLLIHDALAGTVVVNLSSQQIFENEQELISFIREKHRKEDEKSDY